MSTACGRPQVGLGGPAHVDACEQREGVRNMISCGRHKNRQVNGFQNVVFNAREWLPVQTLLSHCAVKITLCYNGFSLEIECSSVQLVTIMLMNTLSAISTLWNTDFKLSNIIFLCNAGRVSQLSSEAMHPRFSIFFLSFCLSPCVHFLVS